MFTVGTHVRIIADVQDMETVGYINEIDFEYCPEENAPYRIMNESQTECLGWYSAQEIESIEE